MIKKNIMINLQWFITLHFDMSKTVQFVINNCFILILNEFRLKFSQSNLISLDRIDIMFIIIFFPIFSLDVSKIWIKSTLALKFCWKFRSTQSSFWFSPFMILNSWIESLYFITFVGVALLWNLCKSSYEIIRSFLLPNSFNAQADAASKCCFNAGLREGINQISQL